MYVIKPRIVFKYETFIVKTNRATFLLDDTGHIPPTPTPSDYFIPKIQILYYDIFHALFGLDSRKVYGPWPVPF